MCQILGIQTKPKLVHVHKLLCSVNSADNWNGLHSCSSIDVVEKPLKGSDRYLRCNAELMACLLLVRHPRSVPVCECRKCEETSCEDVSNSKRWGFSYLNRGNRECFILVKSCWLATWAVPCNRYGWWGDHIVHRGPGLVHNFILSCNSITMGLKHPTLNVASMYLNCQPLLIIRIFRLMSSTLCIRSI